MITARQLHLKWSAPKLTSGPLSLVHEIKSLWPHLPIQIISPPPQCLYLCQRILLVTTHPLIPMAFFSLSSSVCPNPNPDLSRSTPSSGPLPVHCPSAITLSTLLSPCFNSNLHNIYEPFILGLVLLLNSFLLLLTLPAEFKFFKARPCGLQVFYFLQGLVCGWRCWFSRDCVLHI